MCLAIPGKILEISPEITPRIGLVSFEGVKKSICLDLVPEAEPGVYVIVHAGFAIALLNEREAKKTLDLIAELQVDQTDRPAGVL
jgi:hydrogenase expression/formation protein HypC